MIRYITCLGCERAFEVKQFTKHCRDCRLSNQIPKIDGLKYWNKDDLANNDMEGESEESDVRSSDRYNRTVNQSLSANKPGKIRVISSNIKEDKLNKTKSNQNLLDNSVNKKKFNRQRIASQTFLETEQTIDVDDFIEEIQNDSVGYTDDSPDNKP